MSQPAITPNCPVCNNSISEQLGKLPDSRWFAGAKTDRMLDGGHLYRCQTCALKFRYPLCSEDEYRQLYDNAATESWPFDGQRNDWDRIISYLHENLPSGSKVLDFGCYTGGLLKRLSENYQGYGVEINNNAATVAAQHTGCNVYNSLQDIPEEVCFDAIVIADVVEHMADPLSFLTTLAARLRPGGIILLTTGDADNTHWNSFGANWWYCFYVEHISFISEAWLSFICGRSDLSLIHSETFRYCDTGSFRRFADHVQIYCYGLFPSIYLTAGTFARKLIGRSEVVSVPGAGVSDDHLFAVLKTTAE